MGVPQLYRWLVQRYPHIVQQPDRIECDVLHLDMNGIIHPCCHPESGPQPKTEEDMIHAVIRKVEDIVQYARPRLLLYMAVDGVAPRVKLNHQRGRRFRAAQEAVEAEERERRIRAEYGVTRAVEHRWDSNVITPGTPFMARVARALLTRFNHTTTPRSATYDCILSDSNEPGEGEHKVSNPALSLDMSCPTDITPHSSIG